MPYALDTRLTILRDTPSPAGPTARTEAAQALALSALSWVLGDSGRAQRLLDLTGLTPDELRAGLGDPGMLVAVLDFLCAHEPDLLAAADALGVTPQQLAAARERIAA